MRLLDNPALLAAREQGATVVPVFILDEHLLSQTAPQRKSFMIAGLYELDESLQKSGARLIIRKGIPVEQLTQLAAETQAAGIYAEEDYSPYARQRDADVASHLLLSLITGVTVHHPAAVVKADGSPYTIFTPFSRAWKALPMPKPSAVQLPPFPVLPELASFPLPMRASLAGFPAGEAEALRRLRIFLQGAVEDYMEGRNRLEIEGTSSLSPYFRFGMLSARLAAAEVQQAAAAATNTAALQSCETWLNELIWREFYCAVLYHFPYVLKTAFNPALRNIRWRTAPEDLRAWKEGRTGFPAVDAGMRQLSTTGWMHNRARMITASFLVKDLLINWQEGEAWFLWNLLDGDPAANNGGWQWTAGVGTDAAPYFRVFNPTLQAQKFDPSGAYIRRWLPELRHVPDTFIHEPWKMPTELQRSTFCRIGVDYPAPIVDHALARERAILAFRAAAGK